MTAELVPHPLEELERSYDALIANPTVSSGMTSTFRCKDGSLLPFESNRQVHRSDGHWIIVVVARDLRERIAAATALQQSEERFRQLAELSSDWYWEQDEQFRFVEQIGEQVRDPGARPDNYVGMTRWEAHAESLTPQQWAAHRAVLEAHLPFHDFEAYVSTGGYEVLRSVQNATLAPADLIEALHDAGLRGMGGAGFPTARKWSLSKAMFTSPLPGSTGRIFAHSPVMPSSWLARWFRICTLLGSVSAFWSTRARYTAALSALPVRRCA